MHFSVRKSPVADLNARNHVIRSAKFYACVGMVLTIPLLFLDLHEMKSALVAAVTGASILMLNAFALERNWKGASFVFRLMPFVMLLFPLLYPGFFTVVVLAIGGTFIVAPLLFFVSLFKFGIAGNWGDWGQIAFTGTWLLMMIQTGAYAWILYRLICLGWCRDACDTTHKKDLRPPTS